MSWVIETTGHYDEWFTEQTAQKKAQIEKRLENIRAHAHFGHIRQLDKRIAEIKFNDGTRIYFAVKFEPTKTVILLLGETRMAKAKTSRKPKAFSIEQIEPAKLKAGVKTKPHDPRSNLRDRKFIEESLLECIVDGDMDAFKEILKAHYEAVNTSAALKRAGLSKRTFYDALAPDGNPSLSTVMKMVAGLREAEA
jgi:DNA-binding phage protein/putative component of toxin-antitoxin plasmid stabilization module